MKTEDFNRLKEICEREGFIVSQGGMIPSDSILVEVFKKDLWEGVEFVECLRNIAIDSGEKGKIFKLIKFEYDIAWVQMKDPTRIKYFKPSTEAAYIEHLKKTAYEKFGEIKEGDRFDSEKAYFCWSNNIEIQKENSLNEWWYDKEFDRLLYHGVLLYQQGKWATKLPEMVKVEFVDDSWDDYDDYVQIGFIFKLNKKVYAIKKGSGEFLSKQLENYLNNEKQD